MTFQFPKDIATKLDDMESAAAFSHGQEHVTCEISFKPTGAVWHRKKFPVGTKEIDALAGTVAELHKVRRPKRAEEQLAEAQAATAENETLRAERDALKAQLAKLTGKGHRVAAAPPVPEQPRPDDDDDDEPAEAQEPEAVVAEATKPRRGPFGRPIVPQTTAG